MSNHRMSLVIYYRMLKVDFPCLEKAGVLNSDLDWRRTKTSLAEYFSWIAAEKLRTPVPGGFWGPIETSITVKGTPLIRGSLTRLLSKQRATGLETPDFQEIKKIILEYRIKKQKALEARKALHEIKNIIREYYSDPKGKRKPKIAFSAISKIENVIDRWRIFRQK